MNWQSHFRLGTAFGFLVLAAACGGSSPAGPKLPSCGAHGTQLSLAVAAYTSLDPASDSGCVTFAANSAPDTTEYLVLPWSVGSTQASTPFTLASASPSASAPVASIFASQFASLRAGTRDATPVAFDHFLRQLGQTRRYAVPAGSAARTAGPAPGVAAAPPLVGDKRTFKVCSNMTCSTTAPVGAVARSVGLHIAIYVDTLAPTPGLPTSDLDSLRDVFDTRLYPLDTATFGQVSDRDGNGVVIVLMSNQVNKLVTAAQCNSAGYIAGFFFPGDLDPGFATQYNNGEIFYSIVADSNATLSCAHKNSDVNFVTPVTFTHEFQHMINFVQHVLVRSANNEEGWLDEGLSKYAEEIAGRSWGTSDPHFSQFAIGSVYDAYQYMLATGNTPLIIPADTGTLAMVGASWLFTRYVVDQFGDTIPGKLVRSALHGANNVATQTGQPFAQTVSRWALANWVSDLPGFATPAALKYTSWHFRTTFGGLHTNYPTTFPLAYPLVPTVSAPDAVNVTGKIWSGSGAYVRVKQPPNSAAFTLHFSGGSGAPVSPIVMPRLIVLRIR